MGLFSNVTGEPQLEATRPEAYNAVRTITAAATRVTLSDKGEAERMTKRRVNDAWQQDAWEYYDLVGEVKYAFNLFSSVMSRIRLYPAMVTGENVIPSQIDDVEGLPEGLASAAHTALRKLETANGGIPGLLKDAALNLSVAGECFLVQIPEKPGSGTPESWKIKSVDELVAVKSSSASKGGGSAFGLKPRRDAKGNDIEMLPANAFCGRIWRMHPRYSDEADSSLRGILDLMDELLLLSRTARATARSRLNAGALFVPDGLSVAAESDGESDLTSQDPDAMAPYADDETDTFEEELIDAMTTPISDEASAAAVVPLIIRGPSDLGEKIKLIKFERSFDPQLAQRSDKVLNRILDSLDIPKDIVTGLANVKYSNGVQIEESLYKQHVEPMCLMLCDAFTVVFLRPVLRSMGFTEDEVSRCVLWYDPSSVNTKPDKATAAGIGYDKKVLSADAWRRANGFADTDAPPPLELAQRVAIDRGQLSEPLTEGLFKSLVPDLMEQVRQQNQAGSVGPQSPELQDALGLDGAAESPEADGLDGDSIPAPGEAPPGDSGGSGASRPTSTPPQSPSAPGGLLEP